jgi:hypothetical protein
VDDVTAMVHELDALEHPLWKAMVDQTANPRTPSDV